MGAPPGVDVCAGTSGPCAEGMSSEERAAAAEEVLLVNMVLPQELQEADM